MVMICRAPTTIFEALLPGLSVRWGLEVLNVELQDDGSGVNRVVEFAGYNGDTDLAIGADGMRDE